MMESGYCAHCGGSGATEPAGEDERGCTVFVHQKCENNYLRSALGRNLADVARGYEDEEPTRYGHS